MSEQDQPPAQPQPPAKDEQPKDLAPPKPKKKTATSTKPAKPAKPKRRLLPPWKVLLHNDDVNSFKHVIDSIILLTPLNEQDAALRTLEAHQIGVALLLTTHQERAELYQQQFASRSLTVTVEPAE